MTRFVCESEGGREGGEKVAEKPSRQHIPPLLLRRRLLLSFSSSSLTDRLIIKAARHVEGRGRGGGKALSLSLSSLPS